MKMLEMWAKGDEFTSVTLQVTPEQASLLFLGQSNGELSLALRNSEDTAEVTTSPATIRQMRYLQLGPETEVESDADPAEAIAADPPTPLPDVPGAERLSPMETRPESYIHTLRGSQVGRVRVAAAP
jgi:hypothetical protein